MDKWEDIIRQCESGGDKLKVIEFDKEVAIGNLVPAEVEKSFENDRQYSDLEKKFNYARWVKRDRRNMLLGDALGKQLSQIGSVGEDTSVPPTPDKLDKNRSDGETVTFEVGDNRIYASEEPLLESSTPTRAAPKARARAIRVRAKATNANGPKGHLQVMARTKARDGPMGYGYDKGK